MKKHKLVLFSLTVLFLTVSINLLLPKVEGQFPETTKNAAHLINGDLTLGGNEVCVIEEETWLNGTLIIRENASLTIRGALLNQTGTPGEVDIFVQDNASLVLMNATLLVYLNMPSLIYVQGEASVQLTNSVFGNPLHDIYLVAQDRCMVHVENSTFISPGASVVETFNSGNDVLDIHIKNSTLRRVTLQSSQESLVLIENSTLTGALRVYANSNAHVFDTRILGEREKGVTTAGYSLVKFWGSTIHNQILASENSEIWLIRTMVENVSAANNVRLYVVDSSLETLERFDSAAVYAGWDIPLIGIVTVPYEFALLIQVLVYLSLATLVAVALFFAARKLIATRK